PPRAGPRSPTPRRRGRARRRALRPSGQACFSPSMLTSSSRTFKQYSDHGAIPQISAAREPIARSQLLTIPDNSGVALYTCAGGVARPFPGGGCGMFGRRIRLGSLLGFEIRFDLTWLIIVGLIVWSLSVGYFPHAHADLPASSYFWMGVVGAIGLFASILLHELAHSVVGRRMGMRIQGITLFAFGGAAELTEEPETARAEFFMAIAGPVMSVVLAGLFYLGGVVLTAAGGPPAIAAVLGYLVVINLVLAAFNLLPGFPLDGGRVLRAALWAW